MRKDWYEGLAADPTDHSHPDAGNKADAQTGFVGEGRVRSRLCCAPALVTRGDVGWSAAQYAGLDLLELASSLTRRSQVQQSGDDMLCAAAACAGIPQIFAAPELSRRPTTKARLQESNSVDDLVWRRRHLLQDSSQEQNLSAGPAERGDGVLSGVQLVDFEGSTNTSDDR